ncbi:MAG TPA: 2-oxoacid:ferredoxin oxidoreductase subunit beta [Holophagaceae bacterium]|nr:2-oxoacid:ferredoxin oxidoreductase subunit beta [Holophagaceae bacterium]
MTTATPTPAPAAPTNKIGLTRQDYVGSKSTLCPGCGHDSITAQIITAAYEMNLEGHKVAKLSGIGCSSKSPAYFLSQSWGFNSVHGRMPSVATGAALANRGLMNIGVSGDGDSMSIGIGQLIHMIRRNVPMVYICEDNGVYGLTKGQFSATADIGSALKHGSINELPPIDPCSLAIELGCGFVARSFSGDPKQLNAVIKAAMAYKGTAFIDVISPCVTFNNHDASTKSYKNAKDHDFPLHDLGFVQFSELEQVEIPAGEAKTVDFPDGSKVVFRSIKDDYDATDRFGAIKTLHEGLAKGEFVTGLLYINPGKPTLHDHVHIAQTPLVELDEKALKPGKAVLDKLMAELM